MSGCVLLPDPASGNWSSVVGTLSLPYLIVPSPGTLEEVVYYAAWVGLDGAGALNLPGLTATAASEYEVLQTIVLIGLDTATNSAVFNGQTPGFTVYPVWQWWVPIPG
jgi:hypothetical protein